MALGTLADSGTGYFISARKNNKMDYYYNHKQNIITDYPIYKVENQLSEDKFINSLGDDAINTYIKEYLITK